MELLGKLPDLQRFIFVMHTVGDYLPEQIASSFKYDMNTVSIALEAEKTNIERTTRHFGEKQSYETIAKNFATAKTKSITRIQ